MEISAGEVAVLMARLLSEGHGLDARADSAVVHLPGGNLRIAVDAPQPMHDGMSIRVPIGVNHPSWGQHFAWDQSVGIAANDRPPLAEALDIWVHNVFPVFAAMTLPKCDLAQRASVHVITAEGRTADVFYGPLAVRDFGGLSEAVRTAAADRPPTMLVVEELFTGYALPEQPVWMYSYCARTRRGDIVEVVLLNGDSSEGFGHIAGHLPWGGHGSVKSWALVVPSN